MRGGQAFVGVRGEVIGAKGVAQTVGLSFDLRLRAKFCKVLLERDFGRPAKLALGEGAELPEPCSQRGHHPNHAHANVSRAEWVSTGMDSNRRWANQFWGGDSGTGLHFQR